jgi:predicted RNase H-like HicB family nuclease
MRKEETAAAASHGRSKSRRSAEAAVKSHPLNDLDFLDVEIEFDGQAWVTSVPQLYNISTFGDTPEEALDNTSEMLVGWLKSMVDRGEPVPLSRSQIQRTLRAAGPQHVVASRQLGDLSRD